MKSKITIDLDENNQPVIQIKYEASEDVRDKMVERFLENASGTITATWNNSVVLLTPISAIRNVTINGEALEISN